MGWVAIPLAVIGLAALSGGGGYEECCVYDVNYSHYPTAPPSYYYGGQSATPGFAAQPTYQGYGGVDPYAAAGAYPPPGPVAPYDAGAYGASAYGGTMQAGVDVPGPGGVGADVDMGGTGVSGSISY